MDRPRAIEVAKAFVESLDGTYTDLRVAGSLRRRLAYVKDIEVVAVPKLEQVAGGLFLPTMERLLADARPLHGGDEGALIDRVDARMQALLDAGLVTKRLDRNGTPRWGPTLKYLTFQGVNVDLFTPCAERLGWILLLRTGPAAFSRQLVVERGQKTKDGRPGLRPKHIRCADGWLCWTSGEHIPTPTEQEACRVLGIPYAEPWERL